MLRDDNKQILVGWHNTMAMTLLELFTGRIERKRNLLLARFTVNVMAKFEGPQKLNFFMFSSNICYKWTIRPFWSH